MSTITKTDEDRVHARIIWRKISSIDEVSLKAAIITAVATGRESTETAAMGDFFRLRAELAVTRAAVRQALDDMGADGLSICGQSKAMLRCALGTIDDPDDALDYSLGAAEAVLIDVGFLPHKAIGEVEA